MKAILCNAFGPPGDLVVGEAADPTTGDDEVTVAVAYAGLNFPDVLIVQGKYQVRPPFPFSPGAEAAGTVIAAGAGAGDFAPGDRVMVVCGHGAFAERVTVAQASAFKIPATMPLDVAAALPLTYGTTLHALVDRGALQPGETLLVTGAGGGVGIAAVQLGKALGATVIAAAGSPEKLAAAREAGADHGIDYTTENLTERVKSITGNAGADVVYDAVGGDVFDAALRCIAWGGRLLVIGFASGRIPEIPANRLLLKSASAVGVFWGAFAARDPAANRRNFARLMELYEAGKIAPKIGHSYPFLAAPQAIVDMMQRKIVGKAVIEVHAG
jgi:NADPH2:quinone reductase